MWSCPRCGAQLQRPARNCPCCGASTESIVPLLPERDREVKEADANEEPLGVRLQRIAERSREVTEPPNAARGVLSWTFGFLVSLGVGVAIGRVILSPSVTRLFESLVAIVVLVPVSAIIAFIAAAFVHNVEFSYQVLRRRPIPPDEDEVPFSRDQSAPPSEDEPGATDEVTGAIRKTPPAPEPGGDTGIYHGHSE